MKNPLTSIETEVKRYILEKGLCPKGSRLLLAVSGGADSLAMLYILCALRDELGISICAAHFDHLTREGASTAEGDMVEKLCVELSIPCYRGRAEENAWQNGNFENEARKARYAFLQETAAKAGCELIATAHHRDDQAETVLLQLIRGCGTDGLSAIEPKMQNIIRPLLNLSREQIELYCRERGIEYAKDISNSDLHYRRNKIRHQLLPQLAEMNPAVCEALSQTAEICRAENELLQEQAMSVFEKLYSAAGLDFAGLQKQPLAMQRRIVRAYCLKQLGMTISFSQTEALLGLRQGAHIRLAETAFGFLKQGFLVLADELPESPQPFVNNEFKIGSYDLGHSFVCNAAIRVYDGKKADDMIWLPTDSLPSLAWRGRKDGDKMRVKGMEGRKSVKAIMNELHFPQQERAALPLLLLDDEIIWLPFLKEAPHILPALGEEALCIQICRK